MDARYSTDFLLFASLGIAGNHAKDAIVGNAIDRAFRDASSHVLSVGGGNDNLKEAGKKDICAALCNLRPETDFDEWHGSLCETLYDRDYSSAESDYPLKAVTYGIAQKWVNMTIKYLSIAYYALEERDNSREYCEFYDRAVKPHEANLHVPVDRFIIESAWKEDEAIKLPLKEKADRKREYAHPADYCKPWSRWGLEDYRSFQESLHTYLASQRPTPLDWENNAWISAAGN